MSGQVAVEVTRMVSAGNGTHRMVLNLHPQKLGEVRVVVTVRNGDVSVSLAAGQDARTALDQDSPQLHRLLELAGAGQARVVVRDLPAGAASLPGSGNPQQAAGQPGSQPGGQGAPGQQGGAWHPNGADTGGAAGSSAGGQSGHAHQSHRQAGTPGGHSATDGGQPGSVPPGRIPPIETVGHVRPGIAPGRGVDVTV